MGAAQPLPKVADAVGPAAGYDVDAVRRDFPILSRVMHERPGRPGKKLVFLDSAASAQKPCQVLDAVHQAYEHDYANVHRGLYALSLRSTELYEAARETVRAFLNAKAASEIVFTKGATEAINLVAGSFGRTFLGEGDEVVLSQMEHHANIVPWQLLRETNGIVIKVVPMLDNGELDLDAYAALLGPRTKLVAATHCSNALGTINPVKAMIGMARERDIPVLLDGSQGAVHLDVDVGDLDVDFYVFTGHKLYGPTGIGVLYAKKTWLDRMPPYQGGGEMIHSVSFEKTTFAEPPGRFEAGTPPFVQAIGLAAAIDYVTALGRPAIAAHEHALLDYATERLQAIPGLTIIGQAPEKASIISFTMDCAHPHDIGTIIDFEGVAVRAGHHCAQPLMERLGVSATARASFGLYNTVSEVDRLVEALQSVREMFTK